MCSCANNKELLTLCCIVLKKGGDEGIRGISMSGCGVGGSWEGVSWEERGSWGKEGGVDGVVGGSEAAATIPPPPREGRTQKAQAPLICGAEQNKTKQPENYE